MHRTSSNQSNYVSTVHLIHSIAHHLSVIEMVDLFGSSDFDSVSSHPDVHNLLLLLLSRTSKKVAKEQSR